MSNRIILLAVVTVVVLATQLQDVHGQCNVCLGKIACIDETHFVPCIDDEPGDANLAQQCPGPNEVCSRLKETPCVERGYEQPACPDRRPYCDDCSDPYSMYTCLGDNTYAVCSGGSSVGSFTCLDGQSCYQRWASMGIPCSDCADMEEDELCRIGSPATTTPQPTTSTEMTTMIIGFTTPTTEPATNPTEEPTTTPEVATTTPEVATTTPELPTTTPEEPTTTPKEPTTTPEVPTTTPEVLTTTPEVPTTTPKEPTTTPEVPTTTPKDPTTTPEEPTTTPEVTTTPTVKPTPTPTVPTTPSEEPPTTAAQETSTPKIEQPTTVTATPFDLCSEKSTAGRYANPADDTCTTYLNCYHLNDVLRGTLMNCAANTFFNEQTSACGASKVANCGSGSGNATPVNPEAVCSASGLGRHPNTADTTCSTYINCYNLGGKVNAALNSCEAGTYFDATASACVTTKPSGCV